MGFEPSLNSDVTGDCNCSCEKPQVCPPASAMHFKVGNCLDVASLDVELQRVIIAWNGLPSCIQGAILGLLDESQVGTAGHL